MVTFKMVGQTLSFSNEKFADIMVQISIACKRDGIDDNEYLKALCFELVTVNE